MTFQKASRIRPGELAVYAIDLQVLDCATVWQHGIALQTAHVH